MAYFYLKAKQSIAEVLGLERELLLVYSPFPELQARTIKMHDQLIARDRTRLDPVGSVLVADATDTREVVKDYLVTDPERPPIVALSKGDLSAVKDLDSVKNLFFDQLFRRDLFALESPLRTETTFFGRNEIVIELMDRCRAGQNSGLFGLRRIGKTSVLYALARRCEAGKVAGTTYLDVSSPAVYKARWWEVLQRIVQEVAVPLDLQRGSRSKLRALNVQYSEATAAKHFKADVLYLSDRLPGKRLLVLLDEIEHLTFKISPELHWKEDFLPLWQTLRSIHQDTKGRFCFIVVGVNPHIVEEDRVGNYDNPLFSTTKPFFLGPFDLGTVEEMVTRLARYMGISVDSALHQRLFEEYGGHPFLVRQACSRLTKKVFGRPGLMTAALFEQERKHIAIDLERNIRQILNVLAIWYPDEYDMIRLLARGDKSTFLAFAHDSATFTQHVEGYGLVRDARGDPKVVIGLVREFMSRVPKVPVPAEAQDFEGILAEISRRRNAIEQSLRGTLRDGLRFGLGKSAAAAVLGCMEEKRRQLLSNYSFDDVWKEMFLSELRAVIEKQWASFERFFGVEKAEVLRWMDHINRCRADAHAKDLTEEDLKYLRVCFRRFEETLRLI